MDKLYKPLPIASIIMLLLATPEGLPYGYYTLLRIVVFVTLWYMAMFALGYEKIFWVWTFGFISLFYFSIVQSLYTDTFGQGNLGCYRRNNSRIFVYCIV